MSNEIKEILDIQPARLFELNKQGKGPFLRQTKHFEETSELAEAISEGHEPEKIAGEVIDGLLMLLSIAADYMSIQDFSEAMSNTVNSSFLARLPDAEHCPPSLRIITLAFTCLTYIGSLQHITSAVQRHEGVASSKYKGDADHDTIVQEIITSIDLLMAVLTHVPTGPDHGYIQQCYNEKMDKWEKVSK